MGGKVLYKEPVKYQSEKVKKAVDTYPELWDMFKEESELREVPLTVLVTEALELYMDVLSGDLMVAPGLNPEIQDIQDLAIEDEFIRSPFSQIQPPLSRRRGLEPVRKPQ